MRTPQLTTLARYSEIWCSKVGQRQFCLLHQMEVFDQSMQASVVLQPLKSTDALWVATRKGTFLYGLIPPAEDKPHIVDHESGTIPLVLASRTINGEQSY